MPTVAPPAFIRIVTVTVSNTHMASNDTPGHMLDGALRAGGLPPSRHSIVPDTPPAIREFVLATAATGDADALVLAGGTTIAPYDSTYETVDALYTKRLEGFHQAFQRLLWDDIGPRAILQRASAGVVNQLLVVCLPGSTRSLTLAVQGLLLPTVGLAVEQIRGRTSIPVSMRPR